MIENTNKIIRLMQPLCMVEMVKGNGEVKPLDGDYFGVPYLIGWSEGSYTAIWSGWGLVGDVYVTEASDNGGLASWNLISTVGPGFSRAGTNYQEYFSNQKYIQYSFEGFTDSNGRKAVHVFANTLSINVPRYIYLAKVDGMPYHFANAANAQKWIDKTLEREAKTKPKEGEARTKKIASLGAYKARIQKKWEAAKLRSYQNDDLKKKVLDMLVREYVEAKDRLLRI